MFEKLRKYLQEKKEERKNARSLEMAKKKINPEFLRTLESWPIHYQIHLPIIIYTVSSFSDRKSQKLISDFFLEAYMASRLPLGLKVINQKIEDDWMYKPYGTWEADTESMYMLYTEVGLKIPPSGFE
jgi:hypothetical protein